MAQKRKSIDEISKTGAKSALRRTVWFSGMCGLALWALEAQAGVYRCQLPDGRTVYQEAKCSEGKEVITDAPYVRERQAEVPLRPRHHPEDKRVEAARKEAADSDERLIAMLKQCRGEASSLCDVNFAASMLRGWTPSELRARLGEPDTMQSIGGNEIWYYEIWLADGDGKARRRRAQVSFDYSVHRQTLEGKHVSARVNVY